MELILYVFIIGITGTWEGYVATDGQLYNYGANAAGFQGIEHGNKIIFESNMIRFADGYMTQKTIRSSVPYNLTPYSTLNIDLACSTTTGSYKIEVCYNDTSIAIYNNWDPSGARQVLSFNIANINATGNIVIRVTDLYTSIEELYFYRIWLGR